MFSPGVTTVVCNSQGKPRHNNMSKTLLPIALDTAISPKPGKHKYLAWDEQSAIHYVNLPHNSDNYWEVLGVMVFTTQHVPGFKNLMKIKDKGYGA